MITTKNTHRKGGLCPSLPTLDWAWALNVKPNLKLVAVALAMFASVTTGEAWPSVTTLADMTGLNRKTVTAALGELVGAGMLSDTGRREGRTQQVRVYRLNQDPETTQHPVDNFACITDKVIHKVSIQDGHFADHKCPQSAREVSVSTPESVRPERTQTKGTMNHEQKTCAIAPIRFGFNTPKTAEAQTIKIETHQIDLGRTHATTVVNGLRDTPKRPCPADIRQKLMQATRSMAGRGLRNIARAEWSAA
jgi:DNA-binding transcriptional ArsR family regulator